MRGLWEPGRPVRLHRQFRFGSPEHQSPDALDRASAVAGSKGPTRGWYRQAKATKRGEKDGRESERPVVSTRRGNHSEGPRGEKGTPCHDTVGGKHGGCIGTRGRVHETTTDRSTRSTEPGDGIYVSGPPHRHRLAAQRRSTAPAKTERWAWTDRMARTTRRTFRPTSNRCWNEPSPARTRLRRCDESISPRPARRPKPGRWGFRPSRIRCSSGRSSWCWKPSTNRTSRTARTASAPDDRRIKRWRASGATDDGDGRRLDRGRRYSKILRYDRPRPSAGLSQASDAGWGAAATDRQMAQRWRPRRRMRHASRTRGRRRAGLSARFSRTSSCTTCWTNGSSGRSNRV